MTDRSSDFAAQGADAHELAGYKPKAALGMEAADSTEGLSRHDAEMEECAEAYAAYNLEVLSELKDFCADPFTLVEQEVDFNRWAPLGFGTADAVHVADGLLVVVDFKYGRGVQVDAAAQLPDDALRAGRAGARREPLRRGARAHVHLPAAPCQRLRLRDPEGGAPLLGGRGARREGAASSPTSAGSSASRP